MSTSLTNWARFLAKYPSIMLQIENAPTIEDLVKVMKRAASLKNANTGTRRKWADACDRRQYILERTPPPSVPPTQDSSETEKEKPGS